MRFVTSLRFAAAFATLAAGLYAQQKPVLTEDFESGKIDPAIWDTRQNGGETIAVEPVDGAHGKYALHVHFPQDERNDYAFIVATHLPDSVRTHYFGRAYMKISPGPEPKSHTPLIFTGEPGWPLSKFQEIGVSNTHWMPSFQENKSTGRARGEDVHGTTVQPPSDKWFLLEWEFNDNPTTITIWVDGQVVPAKVGDQPADVVQLKWPIRPSPDATTPFEPKTSNLVGGYQEWGFGTRVWQVPAPAMDIYYDDIAISTERIGPVK